MKKQDKLFDKFKNFELAVQSRKLTFGALVMTQTEVVLCTQTPTGSDDQEYLREDGSC